MLFRQRVTGSLCTTVSFWSHCVDQDKCICCHFVLLNTEVLMSAKDSIILPFEKLAA